MASGAVATCLHVGVGEPASTDASTRPASPPTTQSVAAAHETARSHSPGAVSVRAVHAAGPPARSVVACTCPSRLTATHSDGAAHDTSANPSCTNDISGHPGEYSSCGDHVNAGAAAAPPDAAAITSVATISASRVHLRRRWPADRAPA